MWQIISDYIGFLVMTIGVFEFAKIVLNKPIQIPKRKFIFEILIVSILHTTMYFNLKGTVKTIFMSIVNMFFYKCIFKESLKKSLFLIIRLVRKANI